MNALDFLLDLEAHSVILTPHSERLIVDAPTGALTAVDRALLRRLKPDLLSILEGGGHDDLSPPPDAGLTPDDLPPDWHDLWEERAAIMEFDGSLPRERAEALALADALRSMERAGISFRHHT
jgi:hypothetical protein